MAIYASDIKQFYNDLSYDLQKMLFQYRKNIFNNLYFNNLDILRSSAKYILFDRDTWYMRPHVFCKDTYGPQYQYTYPIILTINNISSIFEFKKENFPETVILTPDITLLIRLLGYTNEEYEGL